MTLDRTLATLGFVAAASLADAQLVEIQWDAQQQFQQQLQVAPGKFVELCERLKPGNKVRWSFDGSAPTNFNVHYHEGKEVRFPAKEDNRLKSQGTLDVAMEQEYCWMWTNKSAATVDLNVKLAKKP